MRLCIVTSLLSEVLVQRGSQCFEKQTIKKELLCFLRVAQLGLYIATVFAGFNGGLGCDHQQSKFLYSAGIHVEFMGGHLCFFRESKLQALHIMLI
jgi:hypothetical protein